MPLEAPVPIDTCLLFRPFSASLVTLLRGLSSERVVPPELAALILRTQGIHLDAQALVEANFPNGLARLRELALSRFRFRAGLGLA